ncbi:hypothetical protein [Nocardia sp. NPDC005998]|uniref:hypothetical protein n=1 Tax=Nocardia sp. NPDC005998 TaxID=3156894 RepID=UPI0033BE99D1
MTGRLLLVLGAGPGVGQSIGRLFARDGYTVALAWFGVQKAAVRNLVTGLDTTLARKGHRAVQINGVLGEGAFTRDRVAAALHAAAIRAPDDWTPHVAYDG